MRTGLAVKREAGAGALEVIKRFASEVCARPTTATSYTRALAHFAEWLEAQGKDFGACQAADIMRWRGELLANHAPATVHSYIVAVRQLYKWAAAQGLCKDIAAGVPTPKIKRTFRRMHLTAGEARRLVEAVKGDRNKAIVVLMLYTGLREVEVIRLNYGDLQIRHIVADDGTECTRHILKVWGKGRDEADEVVVLTDTCWRYLAAYLGKRILLPESPLFVGEGNRQSGGRLSTISIRTVVKAALRKIGLTDKCYSTHSLRHTAAVAAIKGGAQLDEIQMMLRHASPATTEIYLETIKEERRLVNAAENKAENYLNL